MLIQSFLSNQQQFTQNGDNTSDALPIKHGVPQGSVLGSLLFLLYINDFPVCKPKQFYLLMTPLWLLEILKIFSVDLFSNNTCLLNEIRESFTTNKLILNASKIQSMFVSTRPPDMKTLPVSNSQQSTSIHILLGCQHSQT